MKRSKLILTLCGCLIIFTAVFVKYRVTKNIQETITLKRSLIKKGDDFRYKYILSQDDGYSWIGYSLYNNKMWSKVKCFMDTTGSEVYTINSLPDSLQILIRKNKNKFPSYTNIEDTDIDFYF